MNEINKEILDKYLVRKSYKQKTAFIDFLAEKLKEHDYHIHKQHFNTLGIKGRNLIVGNPKEAKYIVGAHYDTQASMGFIPNFCAPLNRGISFLYQFGLGISMALIGLLIAWPVKYFTQNLALTILTISLVLLLFSFLVMFGKANKHTYNDNTSGVTSLIDLMLKLEDVKPKDICYILFDLEEIGLVGSRVFLKTHKDLMKEKVLINIDCVSDGTKMLGIFNNVDSNLLPDKENYIYASSKKTIYPSDQKGYPHYIAYCSLVESKHKLLYLSRIHTPRDVIYKEENIDNLTNYLKDIVLNQNLNLITNKN